jgi:hypothetical protein
MNSWHGGEFKYKTREFRTLYAAVTEELSMFKNALPPADQPWIECLIKGFQEKFDSWEHDAKLDAYLRALDKQNRQILRLLGHVYLHVAYDLPRVIAGSFAEREHDRFREIYSGMKDHFINAFTTTCGDSNVVGAWYGVGARLGLRFFYGNSKALIHFVWGGWLLPLRHQAWENAITLSRFENRAYRAQLEANLLKEIWAKNAQQTFSTLVSPLQWMQYLKPPDVLTPPDAWYNNAAQQATILKTQELQRSTPSTEEVDEYSSDVQTQTEPPDTE